MQDWIVLTNADELKAQIEASYQKPVLIFKHSTRCIVSRTALKQFENEYDLQDEVSAYFLDLFVIFFNP